MLGSNINIFNSEWLNVVFAGRNQAYGAYELRRENPRNTNRALIIAISSFVLLLAVPTIVNWAKGFVPKADEKVDVTVVKNLPPPPILQQQKIVPPTPHQEAARPHTTEIRFPPPVVRPDPQVHDVDPPTDKALVDANPGQRDLKGDAGQQEDVDEKHGTAEKAAITEAGPEAPFIAVEISPEYPGGEAAFGKFLQKNIHYPAMAKENGVQGKAYLQFIVERDGSLTDIKSMRDPGSGLGEEAIRVLKMSPRWKPGIQNGKTVRVQYTVPVNFSLGDQ